LARVFVAAEIGRYVYMLAMVDQFKSGDAICRKKAEVGAHTELELFYRCSVDRRSGKASCRRRSKKKLG